MLPEAGGRFGDLSGKPIEFELGREAYHRSYQIMGASRALYPKLARLIKAST
jgi:hypothetical protein